jgi:hypothetical protein
MQIQSCEPGNAVRNHLREQLEPKLNSRLEWLIHLLTQVVLTSWPRIGVLVQKKGSIMRLGGKKPSAKSHQSKPRVGSCSLVDRALCLAGISPLLEHERNQPGWLALICRMPPFLHRVKRQAVCRRGVDEI